MTRALAKKNPTLAELERVIEAGLRSYCEVGLALERIRSEQLYELVGYSDFKSYHQARFGYQKAYVTQLIQAAQVAERVCHGKLPAPSNERQARALAKLPEPEQPKAWAEAVKTAPDGVITAKHVAAVVAKKLPDSTPKRRAARARDFDADIALAATVQAIAALFESWPRDESFQPVIDTLACQLAFAESREAERRKAAS